MACVFSSVGLTGFEPEPGAERELLIGGSLAATQARNGIPVLDTGEHEGQYVIVVPKADKSLAAHLGEQGGVLPLVEIVPILRALLPRWQT